MKSSPKSLSFSIVTPSQETIDWDLCTPEAQEREQLRRWMALPIEDKLAAVEAMGEQARATLAWLRESGRPHFDPETGKLVTGAGS